MRPKLGLPFLFAFASASAALAPACAATPDVQFADADGAAAEGGAESGAADSGTDDASPDAGDDAAAQTTCPSTPPPAGVNACCGATGCVDRGTMNGCASCDACVAQRCQVGEICCYPRNGNLSCKKTPADCK